MTKKVVSFCAFRLIIMIFFLSGGTSFPQGTLSTPSSFHYLMWSPLVICCLVALTTASGVSVDFQNNPLIYDQSYSVSWRITESSTSLNGSWTVELWQDTHGRVALLTTQEDQTLRIKAPAYFGDGFYISVSGSDRTTGAPLTGRSPAFTILPYMRCSDMAEGGWVGDTKMALRYSIKLSGLSVGMPLNITLTSPSPDQSFIGLLYNGTSTNGWARFYDLPLPAGLSKGFYQITSSVQYRGIDNQLRAISCSVPYCMKSMASLKILSPGDGNSYETGHQYPLSFRYNASDLVEQTTYYLDIFNSAHQCVMFYRVNLTSDDHWDVPTKALPMGKSESFTVVLTPTYQSEPNITSTPFTIHNSYCSGTVCAPTPTHTHPS
ncbi:hypothetical protein PAPYR_8272 [Paratrimastix pyriformis]|uniref:Uncharacterized protein n=1 Tax=Paratrimastix pyriformis TaxID=342808 RepID=A0ABQ8UFJ0_9EUKA|nr:hypothetical protein PAPYR_8272 [Paratrimastix pyriformis]